MKMGLSLVEFVEAKLNVRQGVLETGAIGKSEERIGLGEGGRGRGGEGGCVSVIKGVF